MEQSKCDKWLKIRSMMLTASNFGKICRAKESSYPGYVDDQCGIFIDEHDNFLAASPDGPFGSSGIVEIKCPYTLREAYPISSITSNKVPFLKMKENLVEMKKTHTYFYQIQGQLHITQRDYCLFSMWIVNIYRI